MNETYEKVFEYFIGLNVNKIAMDSKGLYYQVINDLDTNLLTFYECPSECSACSFPNNCSACSPGYVLEGVKCVVEIETPLLSTNCVQNKLVINNICDEYCHRKCKTCGETKENCGECAELYIKNNEG